MEVRIVRTSDRKTILHAALLRFIRRHSRLLKPAQRLKYVLMRGPWRNVILHYLSKRTDRLTLSLPKPTLFPDLDIGATIFNLKEFGYARALQVPQQLLDEIIEFRDLRASSNIFHPHLTCDAINRIARDPNVVAVARGYLGVEPNLYASLMYYTARKFRVPENHIVRDGNMRPIHFDVTDFKDLLLFIYLSDVDHDTCPHIVIEGTHKHKTMRELLNHRLTYEQAKRRFGSNIIAITGISGSGFFEDNSAYHMIGFGHQGRWMLSICYTIHRSPSLTAY
jgi:hypothetical protein